MEQKEEEEKESDNSEKLFFSFLSKAYSMFLSGDDNYEALEAELGQIFGAFDFPSFLPSFLPSLSCRILFSLSFETKVASL